MMGASSRLHRQAWLLVLLISLGVWLLLTSRSSASTAAAPAGGQAQTVPTAPPATTTSTSEPTGTNAQATWSNFAPTGWVTATPVLVSIQVADSDGLDLTTAQWRLSTNGSDPSGAWNPASARWVTEGVTTTAILEASVSGLVESGTLNKVQFGIVDTGASPTTEPSGAYTLKVDPAAPTAPLGLAATPSNWTAINSFDLAWTNPADTSGIAGAFYKLDTPPTSDSDFTDSEPGSGNTIPDITVSGDGSHPVYVWLKDEAGNVNYNNRDSTTLLLDITPPSLTDVSSSDHTVDQWSNDNTITMNWTASDGGGSGTAGYSTAFDTNPATTLPQTVNETGLTTTSPPLSDGGNYYFHIRAVDAVGNWGPTVHRGPYKIDSTAPGGPQHLTPSPADWTTNNNFSLSWTNPADTSGIVRAYYKLDNPPTSAEDGTSVAVSTPPTINNIAVNGSGSHTVYVWLKDAAGNVDPANRETATLKLDAAAPAAPAGLAVAPDGWTNINKFSFTWTNPEDVNGIDGAYYRLDTPPTMPNGGTYVAGDDIEALNNLTFSSLTQGQHTLYVWLKDKLGNVDHGNRASVVFKYDSLPPNVGLNLNGTTGSGGWFRSPVQVQVVLTDEHSGPAQAEYRVNSGSWMTGSSFEVSAEGTHTISFRGTDVAGNRSSDQSQTIKIDSQAPEISLAASGTAGENGWFKASPVNVTLTATDTVSGVAQYYYRIGSSGPFLTGKQFQVSGEGEHQIFYYATDWAGNGADRVSTTTIRIDSKAPGVIPYAPEPIPEGVWQRTNAFTITWSAIPDDTSGIAGVYYKLDARPTSNTDRSGVGTEPMAVRNVIVGSEGRHDIYLWLYDRAGNSDYRTYRQVARAFWLDQTPPSTTPSQVGGNTWYTEPVTITFAAADQVGLSGVKETRYQIVGNAVGPWQTGNVAVVNVDGRNTIWYYSIDNAGNVETKKSISVKVDLTAPPAPTGLKVTSAGQWKNSGCYTLTWTTPVDVSGIARAYYKIGDAPTSNDDYLHVESVSSGRIDCLKDVPPGVSDLYLWLEDQAGNVDYRNAAVLARQIWWDPTAPSTALSVPAPDGDNGWYTKAVAVTLTATDEASGVGTTYYRMDNGPWQTGTDFQIRTEGSHIVYYYSTDVAGNKESEKSRQIKVDLTAPTAYILPLTEYQRTARFQVRWEGADSEKGSGVINYDVEVKNGTATWAPWLSGTTATQAEFNGQRGHVYYLRVRARDAAGRMSPVNTDKDNAPYAYVEPVENGDFETGTLAGWSSEGMAPGQKVSVVTFTGRNGAKSQTALLGDPSFPQNEGAIPKGDAPIQQTIRIPSADELPDPSIRLELTFDYNIWTCDTIKTEYPWGSGRYIPVDSFDAWIGLAGKSTLWLHDGNEDTDTFCHSDAKNEIKSPQNLGWKPAKIDLKDYMGQTIVVRLTATSRYDNDLNTYTYVDNVTVRPATALPCRTCLKPRVFVPIILKESPAVSSTEGTQPRQMAPPPPVAPTAEPGSPSPGGQPKRG